MRIGFARPQLVSLLLLPLSCAHNAPQTAALSVSQTRISAGASHTCVLSDTSELSCWGSNVDGQLGDGTTQDRHAAVVVLGVSGATAVSAGSYHGCALLQSEEVSCWGWNSFGQTGTEAGLALRRASTVDGLMHVRAIASGGYHSCALSTDGSGRCWGQNDVGQLGDGGELDHSMPAAVFALPASSQIVAGGRHGCALVKDGFHDGTVQCWGSNDAGELGDGTTERRPIPTLVAGVNDALQLAAGFTHTCALHRDQSVSCWGANDQGQLGDGGASGGYSPTPQHVADLRATAIAAGYNHTCAIRAQDRKLACWGANSAGQLGDGTRTSRSTLVVVSGLDAVAEAAGGSFHTCALTGRGGIQCWGENDAGQLGDGTTTPHALPAPIVAAE